MSEKLVAFQIAAVLLLALNGLATFAQAEDETSNETWFALAEAGFDLETLDGIQSRNSQPLSPKDRKPMDSLVELVDRWDENEFASLPPLSLLDLLADTPDSVCRRVTMIGKVRQCLRIKAGSSEKTASGKQDSFQLTIFPDLDGQRINVKTHDGERVPYGRFAVTVRASRLPPNETENSILNKLVVVDGIHYRFWRYDSVFADQHGLNGQVGALVIAGPVSVLTQPSTALLDKGLMWWLVLLAIGLVTMGWWYGRRPVNADQKNDSLPEKLPGDWDVD